MKKLYLDCSTGVAGDMLTAALFELCADREQVLEELNSLGLDGVVFQAETVTCYGIRGTHMRVLCHGKEEEQGWQPERKHGLHRHFHPSDVYAQIDRLSTSESVREKAKAAYQKNAAAEAGVHGVEIGHVHFHEVGSLDAIADVTAACLLMERLGVERVTASSVCTGYGSVKCAHGIMPVPAPATAALLLGIPSFQGEIEGECCTPTGAALIRCFADQFGTMPMMTPTAIGYGMGTKDFGRLSCVRAFLGDAP